MSASVTLSRTLLGAGSGELVALGDAPRVRVAVMEDVGETVSMGLEVLDALVLGVKPWLGVSKEVGLVDSETNGVISRVILGLGNVDGLFGTAGVSLLLVGVAVGGLTDLAGLLLDVAALDDIEGLAVLLEDFEGLVVLILAVENFDGVGVSEKPGGFEGLLLGEDGSDGEDVSN